MRHEPNMICVSRLTGQWYLVLSWNKDGSARKKIDITKEMQRVKSELVWEFEILPVLQT